MLYDRASSLRQDASCSPFGSPINTPSISQMKMDINITTNQQLIDESNRTSRKFAFFSGKKRNQSLKPAEVRHKTNFGYTFKENQAF
jgi:hypothetical protein